jgi:hypothetical protein
MTYYVERNYCNCHPETCCCNGYAIYSNTDEKIGSYFSKKDAEIVCNEMNNLESVNNNLRSANKGLAERMHQLESQIKLIKGN